MPGGAVHGGIGAAAGLGLLALLAGPGCNRIELAPAPPNVLVVTIDTLRADHVGAYGATGVATPNLDRLAAQGTRFETTIAPTPLTLPSHASLFTGLDPIRHGVRHNGSYRVEAAQVTLAERFEAAGYATAAAVGAAVLAARYGLDQGFASYDEGSGARDSAVLGYAERSATEVTDRALAWLAHAPEPFFLWVHYYDPHALYRPPPPFAERFAHPYDAEVAYVDAELGRLLGGLEATGWLEATRIVVTSDHGESLGEHEEETHGYSLYDAVLRVPLILRGPGIPSGRVVAELARLVDVMPTLLSLAGLEPEAPLDGESLVPLWERVGEAADARVAYAETLATRLDHGWSPLHALRTPQHLYVRAPQPELYDVRADPGQHRNLLARDPRAEPAARLERELAQRLSSDQAEAPLALDADERARLRALGYDLSAAPVPYSGLDPKLGLQRLASYARATRAFARGEYEEALGLAEAALAGMPESARVHGLLAGIHVRLGRSDRALPLAEEAARLVPQAVEYRQLLGDVRYNLGDLAGAIAAYREARALAPESRFVRERLASLEAEHATRSAPPAAAPPSGS